MAEWVVVVTCQGHSFFYPQKNLFCGLVALTWHYLKKRKFGTMNFKLEQRWR